MTSGTKYQLNQKSIETLHDRIRDLRDNYRGD